MNSLNVKKGDTVIVLTGKKGKDGIKGKQGKIISVIPSSNKVIIDGLRIQKRHTKAKSAKSQAGIIEQSGPIDASNVMVICPKCSNTTREGYAFDKDGKKIRICKRKEGGVPCGGSLDKGNKAEKQLRQKQKKLKTPQKKLTLKLNGGKEKWQSPQKKVRLLRQLQPMAVK